ncbi:MAG: pantoate--beta-alanine ligase [Verrucomicrobiota bacterium]
MLVIRSIAAMQRQARQWKRAGKAVGFVPTMGYLHEGHASLMNRARQLVGPKGRVVVSIYVNPTQFGPREDFAKYPRDFARDRRLCARAGVDAIFAPTDAEMYRGRAEGNYSTYVVEEQLSRGMESQTRPEHFRGVTTVVAKLFNIVLPDVAVFGAKDYQQGAIVQRMARDLNFPVRVVVAPTHREADGLAMSSRNKYLTASQRRQAVALWQAILQARQTVKAAKKMVTASQLRQRLLRAIEKQREAKVDYIEFFDPVTLRPRTLVERGTHMALAVYVGKTRLIDNARL